MQLKYLLELCPFFTWIYFMQYWSLVNFSCLSILIDRHVMYCSALFVMPERVKNMIHNKAVVILICPGHYTMLLINSFKTTYVLIQKNYFIFGNHVDIHVLNCLCHRLDKKIKLKLNECHT